MDDQRSHLADGNVRPHPTRHPLLLPGAANYCIVSPPPPPPPSPHSGLCISRAGSIETKGQGNGCEKLIIRFHTERVQCRSPPAHWPLRCSSTRETRRPPLVFCSFPDLYYRCHSLHQLAPRRTNELSEWNRIEGTRRVIVL